MYSYIGITIDRVSVIILVYKRANIELLHHVLCRLKTDIQFGLNFGMKSLLVLTGACSLSDLEATPADRKPHYYAKSVAGFLTCK